MTNNYEQFTPRDIVYIGIGI